MNASVKKTPTNEVKTFPYTYINFIAHVEVFTRSPTSIYLRLHTKT